jgi:hypothetical protein
MSSVAMRTGTRLPAPVKPEPPRLRARILFPFVLAFLVLAGVAIYGALKPTRASLSTPGGPHALVWGNGLFENRAELQAWLSNHGASYRIWARTHPAARALVVPPTRKASASGRTRPAAASVAAEPAAATRAASSSTSDTRLWSWVAIVVGIVLGSVAGLPTRLARGVGLERLAEERELRLGIAGAGAALLVGVVVATL